MKDKRGLYYYPNPSNKRVRMYVKEDDKMIWFRMFDQDDENLWEDHGWIPHEAIKRAASMFQQKAVFDPNNFYDIELAKVVIGENR